MIRVVASFHRLVVDPRLNETLPPPALPVMAGLAPAIFTDSLRPQRRRPDNQCVDGRAEPGHDGYLVRPMHHLMEVVSPRGSSR